MTKTAGILIGLALFAVIVGATMFFSYVSASDTEVVLRTNVEAKQEVCESNRDKLHQTLTNMVGVPREFMDKSTDAFKEIYPDLMEARYGDARGGALMSWVTESNPNYDMASAAGLYENLQIAIEANFKEFDKKQNSLTSAAQEHHNHISTFWNKNVWRLGSRGDVEYTILKGTRVVEEYANDGIYEHQSLFEDSKKEDKPETESK